MIDLSQLLLIVLVTFILHRVPPIFINIESIGFLNLFYRSMRRGVWIFFFHHFMVEVGIHFLFLLILDFFGVFVY